MLKFEAIHEMHTAAGEAVHVEMAPVDLERVILAHGVALGTCICRAVGESKEPTDKIQNR